MFLLSYNTYLVQITDVFFFGLGDEDMVFREWKSDL